MIAFLTSSPGGQYKVDGKRVPCKLDESNDFVKNLSTYWKKDSKVLIISSAPDQYEMNDSIKHIFEQSFPMSSLSISKMDMWDDRNKEITAEQLNNYDVIILSGGHVPTQNAFFHRIRLAEEISHFNGILIGISAGSMNSAKTVYAQPELDGEAVDPGYQRFIEGLGITELMILPHFQDIKDEMLDGMRVIEDIAYEDSRDRSFLCICDGSYVFIKGLDTILYGEGYVIENGSIKEICRKDRHISLN